MKSIFGWFFVALGQGAIYYSLATNAGYLEGVISVAVFATGLELIISAALDKREIKIRRELMEEVSDTPAPYNSLHYMDEPEEEVEKVVPSSKGLPEDGFRRSKDGLIVG